MFFILNACGVTYIRTSATVEAGLYAFGRALSTDSTSTVSSLRQQVSFYRLLSRQPFVESSYRFLLLCVFGEPFSKVDYSTTLQKSTNVLPLIKSQRTFVDFDRNRFLVKLINKRSMNVAKYRQTELSFSSSSATLDTQIKPFQNKINRRLWTSFRQKSNIYLRTNHVYVYSKSAMCS